MKTVQAITTAMLIAIVMTKARSSKGSNYGSTRHRNGMKTSTTMYLTTDSSDDDYYSTTDDSSDEMSTTEIRTTGWSKESGGDRSSRNNRKRKNRYGNGSRKRSDREDDDDSSDRFWNTGSVNASDSSEEDSAMGTTDSESMDDTTTADESEDGNDIDTSEYDTQEETTTRDAQDEHPGMQMANRAETKGITSDTNNTKSHTVQRNPWVEILMVAGIIGGVALIGCVLFGAVLYAQRGTKYNNVATEDTEGVEFGDSTPNGECGDGINTRKPPHVVSYHSSGDEADGEALIQ